MQHGPNLSGDPEEMPFVRIRYLFARLTPMLDAPFIKSDESICFCHFYTFIWAI
jgi:hypothetical protein